MNIVYFGNLGVGRVESLCEVADCLNKINPNLKLDIYGKTQEEKIRLMQRYPNINYCGFVGVDKIREIIETADILIHVESFDPIIMPRLKYAFSTKIAQYLCSGRCVLLYAPFDMASTQYLLKTDAAIVANEKQTLQGVLARLVNEWEFRMEYAEKAFSTALQHHDRNVVSNEVKDYILEAVNK